MNGLRLGGLTLAIVLVVASGDAAPQVDPAVQYESQKSQFVEALAEFTSATAGTYGDEAARVRSSLDAMQRALDRWDQAIVAYEGALRSQAESAETHVALGAVYLDRGRVADAVPEFAAAVRLAPSRPELHVFHGLAHAMAGHAAEAAQSFRQASALDPREPTSLYELSLLLRALGQLDEASEVERRFQAVQRARLFAPGALAPIAFTRPALLRASGVPVFPLARYSAGATSLRQGEYAAALGQFRDAVAADPVIRAANDGDGVPEGIGHGSRALRRGSIRDALDALTAAVALAPTSAEAHRRLGMAYWADEQYGRSVEHLRAAVMASPDDERARLALADVLVIANRPVEAERVLVETVERLPASGQALYRLGRLYHSLERYPEAVRALERTAASGPLAGLEGLHQIVGLVRALQQDTGGTLDAYRRQIAANPNDGAAHRALGGALVTVDRYDDALTEYLAALLVDPRDALAFEAVATIYLERQQYADALGAAGRAVALDDSLEQAHYARATALVRLGRADEGAEALGTFRRRQEARLARDRGVYEVNALRRAAVLSLEQGDASAAVRALEAAVARQWDQSDLHAELGRALLEAGRPEDAVAHFDQALRLDAGADVHRRLAEAYGDLGQEDDRRRHLEIDERQKADRVRQGVFR